MAAAFTAAASLLSLTTLIHCSLWWLNLQYSKLSCLCLDFLEFDVGRLGGKFSLSRSPMTGSTVPALRRRCRAWKLSRHSSSNLSGGSDGETGPLCSCDSTSSCIASMVTRCSNWDFFLRIPSRLPLPLIVSCPRDVC